MMKAAVLHEVGGVPRYEDFPAPVAGEDEVIVDVKAVAVENVDKLVAAGRRGRPGHGRHRHDDQDRGGLRPRRDRADPGGDVLAQAFGQARGEGYDIVLDFLWGRPTEILVRTLIPTSFGMMKPTRLVQVGESAGPSLTVAAASLRTSGVEIYGAARVSTRP
jgi:hypothetical protein